VYKLIPEQVKTNGHEAASEAETFLKENSLCCYYDDVALKALALAQADVNRGVLDSDRVAKINEALERGSFPAPRFRRRTSISWALQIQRSSAFAVWTGEIWRGHAI
jgi:hypothetical protein